MTAHPGHCVLDDQGRPDACNHDGGVGIGAGHVCRCIRKAGHPMTDYGGRAHGCTCGALWGDHTPTTPLKEKSR